MISFHRCILTIFNRRTAVGTSRRARATIAHLSVTWLFHANIYSYVEHDAVIGDYVTFAPRVNCNGNITIKDLAFVGAAAAIRQGASGRPNVIGRAAVIGMGAVVLDSVADGEIVAGNPARPILRGSGAGLIK